MHHNELLTLKTQLDGDLYWDEMYKAVYATDASIYRKLPLAIAHPKSTNDIKKLIAFAKKNKTNIIPRTAGTSLAGQCVGEGIILDVSVYLNQIIEINVEENWVWVQPGMVRDKLNQILAVHRLFFPPETATANRAMIGGMVGNNSCGANSIVYGTTRDYVLELKCILSDGTEANFKSNAPLPTSANASSLADRVQQQLYAELSDPEMAEEIRQQFPNPNIHRRNTGYAVDLVLNHLKQNNLDLTKLLCGSEGTLAVMTAIKLRLVDPPPPVSIMVIPHFHNIHDCMTAVVAVMKHQPFACELMDRIILKCTDGHQVYKDYKFFVNGDPEALLMVEFRANTQDEVEKKSRDLIADLTGQNLGYVCTIVRLPDTKKVWDLRRAGLGLLANMEGKKRAIECIEDTAVAVEDLPAYIHEFADLMHAYGQQPMYYAHAGAGELHLRPVLDMHDAGDRKQFRSICLDSAKLVKKYGGSLSGEHGDGRLRAEFIPLVLGQKNYELFIRIKETWDPDYVFNPGKIVHAPAIDEDLRYDHEISDQKVDTVFDFSEVNGYFQAAARCSGSGDCRKQASMGGTMCPSFMATQNEKDSTRARANALREFYSNPSLSGIKDMDAVKDILDLCLSCKGCHNECPSNVDMTILKSEFSHQYRLKNGLPLRTRLFGEIDRLNSIASHLPQLSNWIQNRTIFKKSIGIHPKRSLPQLSPYTLRSWIKGHKPKSTGEKQPVLFFVDEFTNYYDVDTGIKAILLLEQLGYPVKYTDHKSSGRAQLSKGMLPEARAIASFNVAKIAPLIPELVLVGLEPSAIFSFRDEYPKLLRAKDQEKAVELAKHCFSIEEFLYHEIIKGNISVDEFDQTNRQVLIHGHCHQKALSKVDYISFLVGFPSGHSVSVIPSGCCGMAGSFGYEKEHFDLSMKIGELVLFPAIRQSPGPTRIIASGTSCRHQIKDGTGKQAVHPVEILWESLKNKML